jgi:hypothetical protein
VLGLCGGRIHPRVVQEAQGMHAVLSLVAVDAGVAIVPASMASFRPQEIVYRALEAKPRASRCSSARAGATVAGAAQFPGGGGLTSPVPGPSPVTGRRPAYAKRSLQHAW